MVETLQAIDAYTLHDKMKSDARPVLINVLSNESYIAKHIPGSINIPGDQIDLIETVVPEKEQDIVVYCANADCLASPEAADDLLEMGYSNVWDFEEGLAGWKEAGYSLTGRDTG